MITLDATCSESRAWPEEADIRMDVRKEARPDIVASASYLPFKDKSFDLMELPKDPA